MSHKIIPCGKGFVGKRGGRQQTQPAVVTGTLDFDGVAYPQPQYLDRGGEWLESCGGPPETVVTKPFHSRDAAEAGVKARAAKDAAKVANKETMYPVHPDVAKAMANAPPKSSPPWRVEIETEKMIGEVIDRLRQELFIAHKNGASDARLALKMGLQ